MNCYKCGKELKKTPITITCETLDPTSPTGVSISYSQGYDLDCSNTDCESHSPPKNYVRKSRTGMDPDVPHNIEELIKKIDELKEFLGYEHIYDSFAFAGTNSGFIRNYVPKSEFEKRFNYQELDNRHVTFQVANWMVGKYILFVLTYVEDLLAEYHKNQKLKISYYEIDEYVILFLIRNAVAHGFIWKIDNRFSKFHLPKLYKGFEYTKNLHGKKLDLDHINCEFVYDLLTDLSTTLKEKLS